MGLKKKLLKGAQALRLAPMLFSQSIPSLQDLCLFSLARSEHFDVELGPLLSRHHLCAHNFYHGGVLARIRRGCGSLFYLQVKLESFHEIKITDTDFEYDGECSCPVTSIRVPTCSSFGSEKGVVIEAIDEFDKRTGKATNFYLFLLTTQPPKADFVRRTIARFLRKGTIFGRLSKKCFQLPNHCQGMVSCKGQFSLRLRPYQTLRFRGEFAQNNPIDVMRVVTLNEIESLPQKIEKAIRSEAAFLQKSALKWTNELFAQKSEHEYRQKVIEQDQLIGGAFRDHGCACTCRTCVLLRRSIPTFPA